MNQKEIFTERKLVLEHEISNLERTISALPDGSLTSYKTKVDGKTYTQWYKKISRDGKYKRIYLSKENEAEAKSLAKKMYFNRLLADKQNELKCINYYVDNRTNEKYSALLADTSPYKSLLLDSEAIDKNWEYAPYNKSKDHPEHLIVPAPKGEMVRSKSEAMIAQELFSHGIPYRYEEIHDIYDYPIATDFTILNPRTHKIILWEHFGRADESDYQKTIDFKMYRYIRAGYLPGENMITTFEDTAHPLSYIKVEELVRMYFQV